MNICGPMRKFAIIRLIIIVAAVIAAAILAANLIFAPPKQGNYFPSGQITNNQITSTMFLTSLSFANGAKIPVKFTCDGSTSSAGGGDINPELHIGNVPPQTTSLALIMDDSDATGGRTFTHWLLWNINPQTSVIKEESVPPDSIEGTNDFPRVGYGGPCPPRGSAPHHYRFKLYALDAALDLPPASSKSQLEAAMEGRILARTELVGLYNR